MKDVYLKLDVVQSYSVGDAHLVAVDIFEIVSEAVELAMAPVLNLPFARGVDS